MSSNSASITYNTDYMADASSKDWEKELKRLLSAGELQAHVRAQITKMLRIEFLESNVRDLRLRDDVRGLRERLLSQIYDYDLGSLSFGQREELYNLAYTELDGIYTWARQIHKDQSFTDVTERLIPALELLSAFFTGVRADVYVHSAKPGTALRFQKKSKTVKTNKPKLDESDVRQNRGWARFCAAFDIWWNTPGNPRWKEAWQLARTGSQVTGRYKNEKIIEAGVPMTTKTAFPKLSSVRVKDDSAQQFIAYPSVDGLTAVEQLRQTWQALDPLELSAEDRYVVTAVAENYLPDSWQLLQKQAGFDDEARAKAEQLFIEQVQLMRTQLRGITDRLEAANLSASQAQSAFLRSKVTTESI